MKNHYYLIFCFLLILSLPATAKVHLPHILNDNMIVQQQAEVKFWGTATSNSRVVVKPSWSKPVSIVADKDGKWNVKIRTPKASYTPLNITFDDGQAVTLHNILAGEVWVCAGQSNMEMPLQGFYECPVEGYQDAIATSGQMKGVRYVKIPASMSAVPKDDAVCRWEEINPNSASYCSAVGYFFGRKLHEVLNIPIGLILANKGGTMVESWLDKDYLQHYTDEPTDSSEIAMKYPKDWLRPLLWGNGTFHPILNSTIRGVIFYQGCSNVDHNSSTYAKCLTELINQWRKGFHSSELPFYFVEIAPYNYGDAMGTAAAFIRSQQQEVANNVSNTVLIGTNDLVYPFEAEQIHPCQKRLVGERLAMAAIARDYGFDQVFYRSPSFEKLEIRNDSCFVHLKDTYHGIIAAKSYEGFEIAGQDKVFYPANAQYIRNNTFLLTSPNVTRPVAVRYCYHNFQLGTVKNQAGLPLLPFKTD